MTSGRIEVVTEIPKIDVGDTAADLARYAWGEPKQQEKTPAIVDKIINAGSQTPETLQDRVGKQSERKENFTQTTGDIQVSETFTFRPSTTSLGVNAANYERITGPGSISAVFPGSGGGHLCDATATATGVPLPTRLGGVQVFFPSDTEGTLRPAQLFFVSPHQINAVVPQWAVPDNNGKVTAYIESTVNGKTVQVQTSMELTTRAPGIFSGDSSGTGVAAAQVTSDGVDFKPAAAGPGFIPIEVNDNSVLVMYGTGLGAKQGENVSAAVRATVGGIPVPVEYAGLQGGGGLGNFAGEDQYNLKLNSSFSGMNGGQPVDVIIEAWNPATGQWSKTNVTQVKFK